MENSFFWKSHGILIFLLLSWERHGILKNHHVKLKMGVDLFFLGVDGRECLFLDKHTITHLLLPFEVHKRGILEATLLWNRCVCTQNRQIIKR